MGAVELARLIHGKEVSVAEVVEARQAGRELRTRDRVERAAVETDAGSVGLPVGVQVVARPWREDVVLAVMRQLQEALRGRPDYPTRPPL